MGREAARRAAREGRGEQPQPALRLNVAVEGAHGGGMGGGVLGARGHGARLPEPQRAEEGRAILPGGGARQVGGVSLRQAPPWCRLPARPPGPSCPGA
jgi:hypothetical protein